tara:strand:- start:1961 stop:2218 length:258 start_codon:yes stop_codon:yes gene_type:complete
MEIKFTITDTQEKCAKTVMADIQSWVENAITVRAEIAEKEIIAKLVDHCNANSVSIATGVDAQIDQAYELKLVESLADKTNESTP